MRRSLKSLLLVGTVSLSAAVAAPAALGAEACPNEQLRAENNSTALPDCRAYELVSTDSNHAFIAQDFAAVSTPFGDSVLYQMNDAPEHASAGEPLGNKILSRRDPLLGWAGASFTPPLLGPATSYWSLQTLQVSPDLSTSVVFTTQPVDGGAPELGYKLYRGTPEGGYVALMTVPSSAQPPGSGVVGNADFSHLYFVPSAAQLPSDPAEGNGAYSWTAKEGVRLVGILPDGTPAPAGASLLGTIISPISADASRAVFVTENRLYIRVDDEQTLDVGATVHIDPGQTDPSETDRAGITADGSTVLFTSREALTPDSNTGPLHTGRDLYSYDVDSRRLTDLTPDNAPADAAAGANVGFVAGASQDGSYVYFTAKGALAAGAAPGQSSLYLWHDGAIKLISAAGGLPNQYVISVTPSGRAIVFDSTENLTGYDNDDPVTGEPHKELYEATFGADLRCLSCRLNGTRPTGDSQLVLGKGNLARDGDRVFFSSADAVLPQASSGLLHVFEYEDGTVLPISPLSAGSNANLLVASPSGDDVFFKTFDDLVPNPKSGPGALVDARVGGGFPVPSRPECSGEACQGAPAPTPSSPSPSTAAFSAAGNLLSPDAPVLAKAAPLTRAQKLAKALRVCRARHNKRKRAACEKRAHHDYGLSR